MKNKIIYPFSPESIFDLDKITHFNKALVYGFEPERSAFPGIIKPGSVEELVHGAGQYVDVYNAYLYAQNVILPEIGKTGISNITPEQLLSWIDQIHFYMAATLVGEYSDKNQNIFAGQYTQRQLFRFHYAIKDIVGVYLSNLLSTQLDIIQLLKEEGISETLAQEYISFLLEVRDHTLVEIPEYQKPYLDPSDKFYLGSLTYSKLGALYHANLLSEEEKRLLEKFIKVCMEPTKIPSARQKFAEDLLAKWQTCDPNDINSVSELAFMAFYRITEEHWYFNGNGRTATCFMNTLLLNLGYPSILIRNPNERKDPLSNYSQAIKNIDTEPQFMLQHIMNRIQEAKITGGFEDYELAEIIQYRMKLAKIIFSIQSEFPKYEINSHFDRLTESFFKMNTVNNENEAILSGLIYCSNQLQNLLQKLQAQKLIILTPVKKQYTERDKENIVKKLTSLSGKTGWKCYKTNGGLTILLEVENKDFAKQLVKALNETESLQGKIKINPTTKNSVVYLDSINPEKLSTISVLKNFVMPEFVEYLTIEKKGLTS